MGHAFQQTLMDALIRYHRMRGYNTNCGSRAPTTPASPRRSWSSASSRREGKTPPRPRPRGVRRARLGVEGGVRLDHHAPDAPPRRLGELGSPTPKAEGRLLHDGRDAVARGGRGLRAAATSRASSTAASASSTGTRCCRPRSPTSRSTSRRKTARSGTIRYPLEDGSGAPRRSPRRARRRCSATSRSRCIRDDERYRAPDRQARAPAARRPRRFRSSPTTTSTASSAPAA